MAKVKIDVDLEAATAIATAAQLKSNLAAAGVSMASMGTAAQRATNDFASLTARIVAMPQSFKQVVAATGTTKAATALLGQEVLKLRDEARRMGIETPPAFDRLAAGLTKTNAQASPLTKTFKDIGAGAVALGAIMATAVIKGIDLATAGIRLLVAEAGRWIKEADTGTQAVASLNSALTTAGIMTEATSKHYQDMAASLSATSRATKDELLPLMGEMIATTNLSGEAVKRHSQAALDLAQRYGKSLPDAFNIVQQVAAGNISILSKLNIHIKETGIASYDAERGLTALESAVRGAAAAGLEGWTGQWITANRALADTRQTMGILLEQALLPMAETTARSAVEMQRFVEANKPAILEAMTTAAKALDGAMLGVNVTLIGVAQGLAIGNQAFALYLGTLGSVAKGMEAILSGMIAVAHKAGTELPQAVYDARQGLEGFNAAVKENGEQAEQWKLLVDQATRAMVNNSVSAEDMAKGVKNVGSAYVDADSHVVAFERHRALVLEQERKEMEELSRARIQWAIEAAKALAEPVLKADEAFKTARQNLSAWTSASKEDFTAMSGAAVAAFDLTRAHWDNLASVAALHRDRVNEAIQVHKDFGRVVPPELLRVKMNIDLIDQVLGSVPDRVKAAKQAMSDWTTTTPEALDRLASSTLAAIDMSRQEWGSLTAALAIHKSGIDEVISRYESYGKIVPAAFRAAQEASDRQEEQRKKQHEEEKRRREEQRKQTDQQKEAFQQFSVVGEGVVDVTGRVVAYTAGAAEAAARVAAMTERWRLELEAIQKITASRDISTEDKVNVDVSKGPGKDFVAGLVERSKEAKGPIANWLKSLADAAKSGDLGMMKNIWAAISDQAKVLDKFSVAGGGELASFALNVAQLINTFERLAKSAPGRAAGGPVSAGRMYMVGERGPEPFIPDQNGTILPSGSRVGGGGAFAMPSAEAIGRAVALAIRSDGPKGGGGAFNAPIHIHLEMDSREMTTVIVDNTKRGNYDRRSG